MTSAQSLLHLPYGAELKGMDDTTRSAARAALDEFGVRSTRSWLIAHRHNAIFGVLTKAGERFTLRMARAGCRSAAELESEALWLTELRRRSFAVPQPVLSTEGRYAVCVETPDSSLPRRFLLFRWVKGRVMKSTSGPRARTMGSLLASLHLAAESFTPPSGFQRVSYDRQGVAGGAVGLPADYARGKLSPCELAVVDAAAAGLADVFDSLPHGTPAWGLLHGDLTPANTLFAAGEARAIDFDDLGWGFFAYDVAITCASLAGVGEEARRAFLSGYEALRPGALDRIDLKELVVARHLYSVLWLAAHYLEGPHHAWARESIDWRIRLLQSRFCS